MLPLVLASQIRQGMEDFLRTNTTLSSGFFEGLVKHFIEDGDAVKGPYISLELPFLSAKDSEKHWFEELKLQFPPYAHQEKAWSRLDPSREAGPVSTLVATGTGSGKTECFMLPILEYCRQLKGRRGIKAILIYPVNALATNQVERLEKTISNDPVLHGVRVGLYLGGRAEQKQGVSSCIITDRAEMRRNPPDILLTNYKMLDYLLVRPDDRELWQGTNEESLRYLVVDELHTFDGAQGTDLACLIRRLKARLGLRRLCCVGTSASLGSEKDIIDSLLDYASDIFGQPFGADAVITEERVSLEDFLGERVFQNSEALPGGIRLREKLPAEKYSTVEEYLREQQEIWFHDYATGDLKTEEGRIQLGNLLKQNRYFRELLTLTRGKTLLAKEELADILFKEFGFEKIRLSLLESLCSLASTALDADGRPLLQLIRCQLWLKELHRMLVSVEQKPRILFEADVTASNEKIVALPLVQCRECGAAGWLSVPNKNYALNFDLNIIYTAFFNGEKVVLLYPQLNKENLLQKKAVLNQGFNASFCRHCGHTMPRTQEGMLCPVCGVENVLLDIYWYECENGMHHCPVCGAKHTWSILGSKVATLTSTAISLLYSSIYNTDKKIIIFSDNVQDAAHRSGFFGASTFTMSFVSAVEQVLLDSKKALSLAELPGEFERYWFNKDTSLERYLVHFFSPNLEWSRDYKKYKELRKTVSMRSSLFQDLCRARRECMQYEEAYTKNKENIFLCEQYEAAKEKLIQVQQAVATQKEDTKQLNELVETRLMNSLRKRLAWDCYAIFTLQSQYTRGLEKTLSAMAYVPMKALQDVASKLSHAILKSEEGMSLGEISRSGIQERCHLFLVGFLIYLRQCGAVYQNELLEFFVRTGAEFFSINQPHKDFIPKRASHMQLPRFLTKKKHPHFEPLSESRYATTWCMKWALQIFPELLGKSGNAPLIWIYSQTLSLLKDEKILSCMYIKRQEDEEMEAWGIAKDALMLTTELTEMECPCCQSTIAIPKEEEKFLVNTLPCLNCVAIHSAGYREIGKYGYGTRERKRGENFYGKLYRNGAIERLYTEEYTALLEQQEREAVEDSFKRSEEKRLPFDTNLLSCSPSVEMGIDIGDVSSTIQCSVPSSQAKFLQRIGRLGRKDGNALNIIIAGQRLHDFSFYANPLLMMQSRVTPPDLLFNAPAFLERQFTAFCLECWGQDLARDKDFPQDLKTVLATVAAKQKKEAAQYKSIICPPQDFERMYDTALVKNPEEYFPYNFLSYIKENATVLYNAFVKLFAEKMGEETRKVLFRFVFGEAKNESPISSKILTALTRLLTEKRNIQNRIQRVKQRIEALEVLGDINGLAETSMSEVKIESKALSSIIQSIDKYQTLQFFCDKSILPNYAFPEEKVSLDSLIYYEKKDREEASSIAPEERVDIKCIHYGRSASMALADFAPGVSFYAGKRKVKIKRIDFSTSRKERWRICPNCSYSELVTAQEWTSGRCPRCGSSLFCDKRQERDMLQLTKVYAQSSSCENLLLEEREEREQKFFLNQLLFDYEEKDVLASYRLKTKDGTCDYSYVRKVNFREINFGIASENEQTVFSVDGRVAARQGFRICEQCGFMLSSKNAKCTEHSFDCPAHTNGAEAKVLENLYLYRDFQSDAIFILWSFSKDELSKPEIDYLLSLAFTLGLKLRFGEKLSHIQTLLHSSPTDSYGKTRKNYLVIYDSVSGGTGSLRQLLQKGVMKDIFVRGIEKALNQFQENILLHNACYPLFLAFKSSGFSRYMIALDFVNLLIFAYSSVVEKRNESLDPISSFRTSEKENDFISALRKSSIEDKTLLLEEELVHDKPRFLLTIGTKQWRIDSQVSIDTVAVPSCVDFLFHPVDGQGRELAVFIDDFEFHKNRVGQDYAQRMALVLSGKYWLWALTREDIDAVLLQKPVRPFVENYIEKLTDAKFWERMKAKKNVERVKSSFEGLLRVLADPDEEGLHRLSSVYLINLVLTQPTPMYKRQVKRWEFLSRFGLLPESIYAKKTEFRGCDCFASLSPAKGGEHSLTEKNRISTLFVMKEVEEDELFYEIWRAFLFATNIVQFVDFFCAVTQNGWKEGLFHWIAEQDFSRCAQTLLEKLTDESAKELVSLFSERKMPLPEAGVEIGTGTKVLGKLEMAWKELRIGLVTKEYEGLIEKAPDLGWKLYPLSRLSVDELFGKIELALAGNLDSLHETEGNSTPMPGNEDRPELETDPLWQERATMLIDGKAKDLLFALQERKMPIPEVGIEIGTGRKVLGELEMAWEDLRIGLVRDEYEGLIEKAPDLGWKLYPLSRLSVDELLRELEARERGSVKSC